MKTILSGKIIGSAGVLTVAVLAGMLGSSRRVEAQGGSEQLLIREGFAIAPVPLNLAGKDPNLVGYGSYLVNAVGDCNGCHTAGGPPNFDYAAGYNPYFGQPKKVDPTTYLAGGQDFGPVGPPSNPGPDIIARNLTPDKTGMAEGGHTLKEFIKIIRTGADLDHLHPTCTLGVTVNCIPAPVDGSLLQVMPWPTFQNMTDRDLTAIYEYLSSIPCIEGPADPKNPLHNDCQ
jgi:mono/diheme cytochrome c family protein